MTFKYLKRAACTLPFFLLVACGTQVSTDTVASTTAEVLKPPANQAYAGSTVCSPSRISLMTGKDAAKLHSNANTIVLRPEDKTLAHLMTNVGYKTALFGKFGIGTTFGETDPMAMGFQNWYGLLHNITAHRQYPTMLFRDNKMEFVSVYRTLFW